MYADSRGSLRMRYIVIIRVHPLKSAEIRVPLFRKTGVGIRGTGVKCRGGIRDGCGVGVVQKVGAIHELPLQWIWVTESGVQGFIGAGGNERCKAGEILNSVLAAEAYSGGEQVQLPVYDSQIPEANPRQVLCNISPRVPAPHMVILLPLSITCHLYRRISKVFSSNCTGRSAIFSMV